MKVCTGCLVEKNETEFFRDNRRNRTTPRCKECMTEYANRPEVKARKKARRQDPNSKTHQSLKRYRERPEFKSKKLGLELRRRYGLTLGEFEEMQAQQNGLCLICDDPFEGGRNGPHVDHDHETKAVRGLLCSNCNRGIGCFLDSPDRLRAAIKYLERNCNG